MVNDKQDIWCVIDAQVDGVSAYIEKLAVLKNAMREIIAIAEANGMPGAMQLQRARDEMKQQLDRSMMILYELEELKWRVVPLAPPPSLYE